MLPLVTWTGAEFVLPGYKQVVDRFETFCAGEDAAGVAPGRSRDPELDPNILLSRDRRMRRIVPFSSISGKMCDPGVSLSANSSLQASRKASDLTPLCVLSKAVKMQRRSTGSAVSMRNCILGSKRISIDSWW